MFFSSDGFQRKETKAYENDVKGIDTKNKFMHNLFSGKMANSIHADAEKYNTRKIEKIDRQISRYEESVSSK